MISRSIKLSPINKSHKVGLRCVCGFCFCSSVNCTFGNSNKWLLGLLPGADNCPQMKCRWLFFSFCSFLRWHKGGTELWGETSRPSLATQGRQDLVGPPARKSSLIPSVFYAKTPHIGCCLGQNIPLFSQLTFSLNILVKIFPWSASCCLLCCWKWYWKKNLCII